MKNIRLLVFPLDLDETKPVIRIAHALGIQIIAASSAMSGPDSRMIDHFIHLPFVTEPAFNTALRKAIGDYGITTVFAPHQGVWRHLETLLITEPQNFRFELCQPDPFTATWQQFSSHEEWAANAILSQIPEQIGAISIRPPLSQSRHAAIHRQFLNTPGQCDETKLLALCDIARLLPAGDMLEVGCLYGRSALALGYLAGRYQIGNLICVDPWNIAELTDQGTQAAVLDIERKSLDFERIFRIFLSTVAQLDNVGYIRATSEVACATYEMARQEGYLHNLELGGIAISQHLSLLHIDGNHRYDHVSRDVSLWSPYLCPGGWLLLDDYIWAFGDGPKRVGDQLLESPLYDSAFVSGDTLFLRRNNVAPPAIS